MRMKQWLPAVLAVVLGGAAAKLVRDSMVKSRPAPVSAVPKMIQVTVAATDLLAEQDLRAENLTTSTIAAPTGPMDYVVNPSEILGRVMSVPVVKGQPILFSNLKPKGQSGGIATVIPAGMRAMTINVDEANSIAGMLLPGYHVDVVTTLNAGKKSITRTLVKNVLIQAVGQRLTSAKPEDGKEPPPFRTVTLIVSPREAQIIDLASTSARMRLVLRPLTHTTTEEGDLPPASLADITGTTEDENVVAVAGPTTAPSSPETPELALTTHRTAELIRGSGTTVKVQFEIPRPVEAGSTLEQRESAIPGADELPPSEREEERD